MRHLALLCLVLGAWGCSLPAAAPRGQGFAPAAGAKQGAAPPEAAAPESPGPGPAAVPAPPAAPATLTPGTPVERAIAPGERHDYVLPLAAGSYVRLFLDQKASQQSAVLAGPDGQALGEAGLSPREQRRVLSAVTAAAGDHRLTVTSAPGAPAGSYALRLEQERAATDVDRRRVGVERALSAALARREREGATGAVLADFEAARDLAREAGDGAGEADAWNEIGVTHFNANRYPEALAAFAAAAARAREAGYTWGEAYALNNQAVLLQDQRGKADQALAAYQRALALWAGQDDLARLAETSYNLGIFEYSQLSDYAAAAAHFARALELYEGLGQDTKRAWSLNGLGLVAQARSEPEEALRLYDRAIALARRYGEGRLLAAALRNRAIVQRKRGELQEALAGYEAVLVEGRPERTTRVRTLHDRASLYLELGDLEKAEASYREAIALLAANDPDGPDAVNARINLGWVLQALGQPEAALQVYQRALALAGDSPRQEALALLALGQVHLRMNRPADALTYLEKSLAVRRRAPSPTEDARTLVELSNALRRLGRREEAAGRLEQALELARAEENPALTATCLLARASLDRESSRLDDARGEVEQALGLIEQMRHEVSDDGLRASFFATRRSAYELYVDLLMDLDRLRPGRGYAAEALAASERARARGLLDLLAEGKINVERGVDPDLKRRETDLAQDLAWTGTRLAELRAAARPDVAEIARLNQHLLEVESAQEVLAGKIRQRNPRYAQMRDPRPLGAEAIRGLLDERTALLEYAVGEGSSYLFVVTREGVEAHRLPPAGEIRAGVGELRRAIAEPSQSLYGRYVERAADLYQTLLGPAAATLAAKPALLIAPDGPLHLLPFEALLEGGGAANRGRPASRLAYLLRRHAVSYVPSASALAELRAPGEREGTPAPPGKLFLAFADPTYGGGEQVTGRPGAARAASALALDPRQLSPLPGTGEEVSGIAALYRQEEVKLYLHGEATETNVKSNPLLESAHRIHFATHGLMDESQPQLSGLAMAAAPGSGEDGVLRVNEIFNLRLNADLVVLSACETGLGKEVSGEGLVGLTQAFFYAGTRSLMVSLWKASEASTPGLMIDFYRRLEAGVDKPEALRQAKLELIQGQRAHPFYWAPFVLIGDSRTEQ